MFKSLAAVEPTSKRSAQLGEDAAPEVGVKGSMVRSVAAVLAQRGLRDAVTGRVGPEARALLLDPPLPTQWVDARVFNQIYDALYELLGAERLRTLNKEAVEHGLGPLLRATAERVLRIFGASPATLFSKLDRVAGSTARGVTYHYEVVDAKSGLFDVEYPSLTDVPLGPFVATGGALEMIFDMCGVQGSIGDAEWVPNGRRNRVRFKVSWREPRRG